MKRIAILVLSLVLILALTAPAWGYTVPATDGEAVVDSADVLSDSEIQNLEQRISGIKQEYAYDFVIHTTSENIDDTDSEEIENYIDDFCSDNGYCTGDVDGGLLLVCFNSIDTYVIKEVGTGVYTGENLKLLNNAFSADLSSYSDFYQSFDKYITNAYTLLKASPNAESLKANVENTIPTFEFTDLFSLSPDIEGLQPDRGESIVDDAELLEYWQENLLATKIKKIIEEYSYDVVIHTTPTTNKVKVEKYVDDFYYNNGYGYGKNKDGMVFALVMDSRDYYTSTCGLGIDIFNDNAINYLGKTIVDDLSNGDYYEAFSKYLDEVEQYLYEYKNGIVGDKYYDYYGDEYEQPVDSKPGVSDIIKTELGILVFALIVAGIAIFIMMKKMNTAVAKREADEYIRNGSVNINYSRDTFLYDTVTKRAKPKDNGGSSGSSRPSGGGGYSGGSRTHTSSSGRSHGGGGGKF